MLLLYHEYVVRDEKSYKINGFYSIASHSCLMKYECLFINPLSSAAKRMSKMPLNHFEIVTEV